ncbi:uncharacterized protein LOC106642433 [Copidosoma floridanum]|uniref:uncharacterized protein LOC106642433 n=1 Tax=Copidosoma floridanum TaxID=29053 RepID=UPI0006C94801|nr:uncharacterized protein LOC106642433 [Copidosoma floridanum]
MQLREDCVTLHEKFKREHALIENECPAVLLRNEYFSQSALGAAQQAYSRSMRSITRLLAAHSDPQTNSSAAATTVSHTQRGKLLEIKLPQFSGNYTEWLLQAKRRIPPMRIGSVGSLMDLSTESRKLHRLISGLGSAQEVLDALFVDELLQALDRPTKEAWGTSTSARADFLACQALEKFLIEQAQALEMIDAQSTKRQDNSPTSSKTRSKPSKAQHAHTGQTQPLGNTQPGSNAQQNRVGNSARSQDDRPATPVLPCTYCNQQHFIARCPAFAALSIDQRYQFVDEKPLCFNCLGRHAAAKCMNTKRCQTCAVAQVRAPAAHHHLRLLIDQGSELSYILEDAVKRLQLTRTNVDVVLHISPRITAPLPSFQCKTRSWLHTEILELADPHFYLPRDISLLLGTDYYSAIITSDLLRGSLSEPIAQRTLFGWISSGCVNHPLTKNHSHTHHVVLKIENKLQKLLINFWIQKEVPSKSSSQLTPEEQECEEHFVRTHSQDSTGRYVVKLSLKQSPSLLGNSVNRARKYFDRTVARLKTDDKSDKLYTDFMNQYLSLGHMRPVPADELNIKLYFYVHHHGVLKEDGDNAIIRVVFNGSALISSGHSLKSITHTGPNLLPIITDILFWLRTFKWTFSVDISKMYHQIKVYPDDWDLQRIIWHSKTHEEAHFQLTTVTYGTRLAPFLATRSLLQLVKDEGHRYSKAARILTSGRYVDDIFGGAETPDELNEQALQLKELCMAGGLSLAKWHLNSPGFSYSNSMHLKPLSQTPTKRIILSETSQIFNPPGIVAPVIVAAKLIIQELWLPKITWNTPITDALAQRWLQIRDDLAKLSGVTVPRWLGAHLSSAVELHGFADASQDAMGAVIYLVMKSDSSTSSSYVCSKTKVSPLKRMSIPRLELTAAFWLNSLNSLVTLYWIPSHPNKWKDYVRNRVAAIQDLVPAAHWRHVPEKENPADCASRGILTLQLIEHRLWWYGPKWMIQPQNSWASAAE